MYENENLKDKQKKKKMMMKAKKTQRRRFYSYCWTLLAIILLSFSFFFSSSFFLKGQILLIKSSLFRNEQHLSQRHELEWSSIVERARTKLLLTVPHPFPLSI